MRRLTSSIVVLASIYYDDNHSLSPGVVGEERAAFTASRHDTRMAPYRCYRSLYVISSFSPVSSSTPAYNRARVFRMEH